MKYVFDFDGTLCTQVTDGNYTKAEPIQDRIDTVNKLYNAGHKIKIYTARGMGRFEDNQEELDKIVKITYDQLNDWGVLCHELIMRKPSGDLYVDDKGINADEFFESNES